MIQNDRRKGSSNLYGSGLKQLPINNFQTQNQMPDQGQNALQ